MRYDLKLSKKSARHILDIVEIVKRSLDGYWCDEIAAYNQTVDLRTREKVNRIAERVLRGEIPKAAVEKYL